MNNKKLKTDRKFFLFLLLNFITFGIYHLYFIHSVAKEINITCQDDDRHTDGLFLYLIITALTFGLYSFIWFLLASNRIKNNWYKKIKSACLISGTSFFCWTTFGSLLLGLGPMIAQYKFLHAVNELNAAY